MNEILKCYIRTSSVLVNAMLFMSLHRDQIHIIVFSLTQCVAFADNATVLYLQLHNALYSQTMLLCCYVARLNLLFIKC